MVVVAMVVMMVVSFSRASFLMLPFPVPVSVTVSGRRCSFPAVRRVPLRASIWRERSLVAVMPGSLFVT